MIRLGIRITGSKPVEQKLERGTKIRSSLPSGMKKAVLYVHSQVPAYPPASPESSYTRTGTLGRSVTAMQGQAPGALSRVESIGGGYAGVIGTNVVYAPYVIDENRQAFMHRGRWWTLQKVVQKAIPGVKKILRKHILDYLGA